MCCWGCKHQKHKYEEKRKIEWQKTQNEIQKVFIASSSVMICIFLWSELSKNNINGNKNVQMSNFLILWYKNANILDDCNNCGSFYYLISFPGTSLMHTPHLHTQKKLVQSLFDITIFSWHQNLIARHNQLMRNMKNTKCKIQLNQINWIWTRIAKTLSVFF